MEVEDKDTQLREKISKIDRQQKEIQALRVGIHFTLEVDNHFGPSPKRE